MNPTVNPMGAGAATVSNPYDLLPMPTAAPVNNVETVSAPGGKVELGERGRAGTYIFGGIITQEEYNKDLQRWEALAVYDQMRRSDSTVRALLNAVKLPILSTMWSIQPASDDPQDIYVADFIRRELFSRNVTFSDLLREALLMLDFGYSVFERVLEWTTFTWTPPVIKPDPADKDSWPVDAEGEPIKPEPLQPPDVTNKLIGLAGLHSRKQRSIFKWAITGDQPGITQIMPGANYEIPMSKLVIFTNEKEGDNFEGISMLRSAYQHWYFKKNFYLIDGMKNEKQSLGEPYIKPTAGADQTSVQDAIDAVQNMRANEKGYTKIPDGWDIGYMDMKAPTTANIWPSIDHHNRQILLSGLAQFLDLGTKGGGSKALSADHSDLFQLSLEALAKNISSTLQRMLINPLCDINFPGLKDYPRIEHAKMGDDDVTTIASAVSQLMTATVLTPDPDLEQAVRTILHLPDLPDDIRDDYANRITAKPAPAAPTTINPNEPAEDNENDDDDEPEDNDAGDGDGDGNSQVTASAFARAIKARESLMEAIENEYAR